MREDTVVAGRDGDAIRHAGAARWSVPGYTELKALGSGGFGDVVLARREATGALVAIKYMRRKLLADPQWAQMFRAEAQVLAILDDPNIVRLDEYVESPSGAAIVMELVDGVSVREILARRGATTPEAALVVLRGSLLGLAAAHRRGVVHRDYKPENVLVDGNGASKLTDFGIAARAGAEPVPAGSLMYAPPEQFAGAAASPAGDVYAATATFFECLTGRPPFTGDTVERLLYLHRAAPVPLEPVPEPLRPLVAAGLAKQPGNRPGDAAAFVTALEAVAARRYGPDWAARGRSWLGEAALLLAALWPSGAPPAVHGSAVEQVGLSRTAQEARNVGEARHLRHLWHLRHLLHLRDRRGRRALRLSPVKAAVAIGTAAAVAVAGVALAVHLTGRGGPPPAGTLPAVTGVSPAGGTDMGGTLVTITGTGLAGATMVTFGGVAGRITADSDTRITVASPPSAGIVGIPVTAAAITADAGARISRTGPPGTGTVDIAVTTPAGTSKPTAADHYTFTDPRPAVIRISPDSGSTAGGTTVSITGTGLAGATGVRFGTLAGQITADSNTQVTAITPAGTGTVNVTVTTPAGTSPPVGHYTYTARPERTQSISFTAPAPGTAGSSAALSATASSALLVVFTVDRASGPGVCTVSGRTVSYAMAGPCVIDASQAGNGTYAAAPQVQQTITVTSGHKPTTTTALSSSANPSPAGQPVRLTARVSPASATGTVTFYDGGTEIGAAALDSGTATITTPALAAGTYTITVSYGGDQNFAASTGSLTQTVNVNQVAPTVTASATVSPASYSGSACPAVFTFSGTIHVSSGPVTVTYKWIRSDGAIAPEHTITFTGSGAQDQSVAPETWTLSANGTHWEAIQIVSPGSAQSNEATFTLNCQALG